MAKVRFRNVPCYLRSRTDMSPEMWIVEYEGVIYECDKYSGADEVCKTVRFDREMKMDVCDAKRDFGGCGKDAIKLETRVPFYGWLVGHSMRHYPKKSLNAIT